jgi:hypothetical protein
MTRVATAIALSLMLPLAAGARGDEAQLSPEQLETVVPELILEDATLQQAIETLAAKTRANIVIDWQQLQALGLGRDRKLRLRLYDLPLRKMLDVVMAAYCDRERMGGYICEDGQVIRITAVDPETRREIQPTLVYDVRDFTDRFIAKNAPAPEFPASFPRPGVASPTTLPYWSTRGAMVGNGPAHLTPMEAIDYLVKVIEEVVSPLSWRDDGGTAGAIREMQGILIVTQTPAAHRDVQRVLKNLRKFREALDRGAAPTTQPVNLLEL